MFLRPRLPTLATVHDLIPWHYPAYRANRGLQLYTRYVAAALPHAHHLFTVSHTTRRELLARWPHWADKTTVVYNAAAPHFHLTPSPDTIQAIDASGLPVLHKPLKPAKLRAFLSHLLATPPGQPAHKSFEQ